ncbi:MAG TPA: PHP domain-containing protein [bacterium]|nr:PHP domain-containing protein [bacterium]HPP29676.1 PHP domain-containing protein [bacterium]
MKKNVRGLLLILLTVIISRYAFSLDIKNPYENVRWNKFKQYNGNLHTHTKYSDGILLPHEVIDRYKAEGYSILAITDHNRTTFPWESLNKFGNSEDRYPEKMKMLAIQGNEFSLHHHLGSYFSDAIPSANIEQSLKNISKKDGIAVFFHPGRYNYPDSWYVDLYTRYPVIVGMEVYNQGNRWPLDQILWDRLLIYLMPDRPVWGFANDDAHIPEHIGRSWNVFLLKNLSNAEVRRAMKEGSFYFSHSPDPSLLKKPPIIKSISVSREKGEIKIHIQTEGAHTVEWISDGRVIATGNTINLTKLEKMLGSYIRVRLVGDGGYTHTQPFGVIH